MSEKRSWDIGPRGQAGAQRAPLPLREQRRKKRRALYVVLLALVTALAALALYLMWLPALRIQNVDAQGPDALGVQQVALRAVQGTYWYIAPRNSIFILPQQAIRSQVLDAYPDIAAISIKPETVTALRIISTSREQAFVWCGANVDTPPANGQCYAADASGLIFAPLDASSTQASSTLRIFAPLNKELGADASPIRAHVVASEKIPGALQLVKALRNLGAPVSALALNGDEGTFYLQGPTKVLYVLGHEEAAAELAASTFPKLNLTDGSIDYVDLRFTSTPSQPSKVYVKKFGQ